MKLKSILMGTVAAAIAIASTLPARAEFADRTLRLSNGVNQDHPVGNGVEAMRACLNEKSGGKMKIADFWGGALGGDLQATQALRSGTKELRVTTIRPLVRTI